MHPILRDLNFKEIAETKADSKNRITLGNVHGNAHHYKIYVNEAGQIVLDPQMVIPASEMWLFKNKKAFSMVTQGLSEARAGKLVKASEDYSKHLDDK